MLYFAVEFVQLDTDKLVFGVVVEQLAFPVGQFAVDEVAYGIVLVFCVVEFGDSVVAGVV